MTPETALSQLHYLLVQGILQLCVCPGIRELAERMGVTEEEVENLPR